MFTFNFLSVLAVHKCMVEEVSSLNIDVKPRIHLADVFGQTQENVCIRQVWTSQQTRTNMFGHVCSPFANVRQEGGK